MEYHVLKETPDNSGNFIDTGMVVGFGKADLAAEAVANMSAGGGRFAIYPYDPMKRVVAPAAEAPAPVVEPAQPEVAETAPAPVEAPAEPAA